MRARVAAYAGYQLRDFLAARGLLVALVVGTFAAWRIQAMVALAGPDWATGVAGRARALRLYDDALLLLALGGALVGVLGIVSRDRRRGFSRLLFARAVGAARYYAQAYTVRGVALVAGAALGAQLFSLFVRPVSVAGAAAFVAVAWLVVGGLGLLLSALTNRDGVLLVMALAAAFLVNIYRQGPPSSATGAVLAEGVRYLLPPMHALLALRATFARGAPPDPQELGWAIGFGAICVAAALIVLRRRSLAA